MFKIWLKSNEFEGIKNPVKKDDISRVLAGVDDDFDLPDWGWCLWSHFGLSPYAHKKLCLKFD